MEEDILRIQPTIEPNTSIIKIIGVGGGGGNAVCQMFREGIPEVRFLVCNTDEKALVDSIVPTRIQLGPGLGAGGKPELGRQYAEESIDQIDKIFDADTKMVFITAGMGGGTGTGASPVIAREARKHGVLTIGVVTIPFLFEQRKQIDKALDGLDELSQHVDAMLVINNERLREIYPSLDILNAFKKADETLSTAVRSIVEIITMHGTIGLDFRDVNNVLRNGGVAIMSSGIADGEGRVTKAIEKALYSPLVNNNDIYRARRLIFAITTSGVGNDILRMEELQEIHNFTARFHTDVETKWGLVTDDAMGKSIKITILASGFKIYEKPGDAAADKLQSVLDDEARRSRREHNYPELAKDKNGHRIRKRPRTFLYDICNLDDEELTEKIERTPTALRGYDELVEICELASRHARQPEEDPAPAEEQSVTTIRFDVDPS